MNNEIYTVYAQDNDMTFIMRDMNGSTKCVGWYFGEPNEDDTAFYADTLKEVVK